MSLYGTCHFQLATNVIKFSLFSSDLILFCVEAMLAVVDPLRRPALGAEGGGDPVQALGVDPAVQVADTA